MNRMSAAVGVALIFVGALSVQVVSADNDPAPRFKGAPTYDFGVTNVRREAATPEYSYVTFDLSWSYSCVRSGWRLPRPARPARI
jgi:hypothetical protein